MDIENKEYLLGKIVLLIAGIDSIKAEQDFLCFRKEIINTLCLCEEYIKKEIEDEDGTQKGSLRET